MKQSDDISCSLLYCDFRYNGLLIRIVADDARLADVRLEYARTSVRPEKSIPAGENAVIKKALRFLDSYFLGKSQPLPPLDLSGFTANERRVYDALMMIPFGETVSYGNLALRAGFPNAARFVGSTMRKNRFPIFIPCHRVVPATGGIGNFSPDPLMKSKLISFEQGIDGSPDFSI
jgi:O-6-methylguanine DNA methyltransferase